MKKLFLTSTIISVVFLSVFIAKPVFAAVSAIVKFSPTSKSVANGSTSTININVDPAGNSVTAFDLVFTYDPAKVTVTMGKSSATTNYNVLKDTNTGGKVSYSLGMPSGGTAITADSAVAVATIKGIAVGTSALTFDTTAMTVGASGQTESVLSSTVNGSVIVTAAVANTPTHTPTPTTSGGGGESNTPTPIPEGGIGGTELPISGSNDWIRLITVAVGFVGFGVLFLFL